MTPRELIPESEYKKIKDRDMKLASDRLDKIRNSTDKHMMYKDSEQFRPVMDLKQMFETSVEMFGDNPAFWVKDSNDAPYRKITYKEAKADVDALGTALHRHDMRGRRISVIGENCYEWAIAYLAAVCGTGVVVPLDRELSMVEIENLLIDADVECIFYTAKYSDLFKEIKDRGKTKIKLYVIMRSDEHADFEVAQNMLIEEGEAELKGGNRDFLDAQIDAGEMGILLYTSGTTGIAKGVMLSHNNICTDIMISPTVFRVNQWDIFFSVLPLHHTYACTCDFLVPLYMGASIAYCQGLKYIVKNLSEARPTMFLGVPLLFENLYGKIWQNAKKSGKDKMLKTVIKINRVTKKIGLDLGKIFLKDITNLFGGRMRVVICGGAAIDPNILKGIQDFGINAIQGYGLTECGPICALNPDKGMKDDSAGYLIPGFDGKIVDADPETGIGEICAKGENIMLGYYNNPEATAEVMEDGWFHTGDYGYIDSDRFVHITGRKKSAIITKNGKNVFPEELEYLLGRLDIVDESMVWARQSKRSADDVIIVASIKPNEEEVIERLGKDYTQEDLGKLLWKEVDDINKDLAFFKKIKKIILRNDEFEKTTGKKIKRFVEENKEGEEV